MNQQFCDTFIKFPNSNQFAYSSISVLIKSVLLLVIMSSKRKNVSLLEMLKLIKESEAKSQRNCPSQFASTLFLLCRE